MNFCKTCLLICIASSSFYEIHTHNYLHDHVFKKVAENLHNVKLLKSFLPYVLRNHSQRIFVTENGSCSDALRKLEEDDPLPLSLFVDALGKPGAGFFQGNLGWYGGYEECLTIPDAHYCAMRNIAINSSVPLLLYGICVPAVCTVDDVTRLLNVTANIINKLTHLPLLLVTSDQFSFVQPLPSQCFSRSKTYTTGAIVMIVISLILLLLCFSGTVAELMKNLQILLSPYAQEELDGTTETTTNKVTYDREPMYIQFLLCFSLIKNTKAVLDTKAPSGSITSINGIRTLSITWVILGHLVIFAAGSDNFAVILTKWIYRFSFQAVGNAAVSVDTFFVLSGLLVGYLSFKRFESHGKLPLVRFYLHRYIRLTVSYAYLLFFVTYLYPYLHHGPNWNNEPDKNCRKYWWTNLLYVNNLYPTDYGQKCYNVTWYLANDMQFYVISPIILWCMYKWKSIGVLLTGSALMLEYLLANGILIDLKNATPLLLNNRTLFNEPMAANYQNYIYQKPYTRIAPYVIGLILGYILFYKKKIPGLAFKNIVYLCGWLVAIGVGLAVVYGPYTDINGHQWNFSDRMTYGLFFRIAWALAVSWVIYACHNGYGSIINDFLSWGAFLPLSRLTYGTYLIHWYVISFFFQGLQTPFHITEITVAFLFIAVTVISYMLSFVVAVLIDFPVGNLEKLFLKF